MRRCQGAKIDVSEGTQQMGVKSAKEVEDEGKKEKKLKRWRERRQRSVDNAARMKFY